MGILLSRVPLWGLFDHFFPRETRVLMLGLDAAGKTSILYRLKLDELLTTVPVRRAYSACERVLRAITRGVGRPFRLAGPCRATRTHLPAVADNTPIVVRASFRARPQTIGFNVESTRHRNLEMTLWDVGGQDKIRQLCAGTGRRAPPQSSGA